MLTICPKISTYRTSPLNNGDNNNALNLNHQNSAKNVAFKRYIPEPKYRRIIKQFMNVFKSKQIDKIAIVSHKIPDFDAECSEVLLKRLIEKKTGKHVDVFVLDPLQPKASFLNQNKEIIVLKDAFNHSDKPNLPVTAEEIYNKYGDYDLVLGVDLAKVDLLDEVIKKGIWEHAKEKGVIDHHIPSIGSGFEKLKLKLIDETKDSTTQMLMQFVTAFGINPKKVSAEISDPIFTGIIADTKRLEKVRNPETFKDIYELSKTSDTGKLFGYVKQVTPKEFKLIAKFMSKIKLSKDKEVGYIVVDCAKEGIPLEQLKNSVMEALEQIPTNQGVKYYFSVIKNSNDPVEVNVSLRSLDKSIVALAQKHGGGGHDNLCAFSSKVENVDKLIEKLLEELNEIKNS